MNYQIIKNEKILKDYIDDYLPDLLTGETYFIRLITRSKYVDNIENDFDIKSFTVKKENIIESIKQLECEVGSYFGLDNDSIGIYLNPNPRSQEKAMRKTFIRYGHILSNRHTYKNVDPDPLLMFFLELKRSMSRKIYHDLDFDKVNVYETIDKVLSFINYDCVSILPTKMGVHFLIKLDKLDTNKYPNWHEDMKKIKGYDTIISEHGDNNLPIPGCNMFGFVPTFIK